MKKLLIILVCIFIFFEVNSEEFQMKYYSGKEISMKKC